MFVRIIRSRYVSPFLTLLMLVSLILPFYVIAGCTNSDSGDVGSSTPDIDQMYQNAVNDARVAEYSEISRNLTPINKYNPDLVWDGEAGTSRVLVVTWTSGDYYDNSVGQDYDLPVNVWVTVCPELQDYFKAQGISADEITSLQVEQILGLPPNDGKTKFVEMWASPSDLFRPSPDPEITDREAEIDFPPDKFRVYSDNILIKEGGTNYTYKEWFNYLESTSYTGEKPQPWTRLGYTYNWGDENHVGLSEFIIKNDYTIGIKSITPNSQYFRN